MNRNKMNSTDEVSGSGFSMTITCALSKSKSLNEKKKTEKKRDFYYSTFKPFMDGVVKENLDQVKADEIRRFEETLKKFEIIKKAKAGTKKREPQMLKVKDVQDISDSVRGTEAEQFYGYILDVHDMLTTGELKSEFLEDGTEVVKLVKQIRYPQSSKPGSSSVAEDKNIEVNIDNTKEKSNKRIALQKDKELKADNTEGGNSPVEAEISTESIDKNMSSESEPSKPTETKSEVTRSWDDLSELDKMIINGYAFPAFNKPYDSEEGRASMVFCMLKVLPIFGKSLIDVREKLIKSIGGVYPGSSETEK